MSDYLRRARSVLQDFLRGRHDPPPHEEVGLPRPSTPADPPVPAGDNLVIAGGSVEFVDPAAAGADPVSWLAAFEAALERDRPLSAAALAVLQRQAAHDSAETLLPSGSGPRLLGLLRPRPGLSARLGELHRAGLLAALFPEAGLPGPRSGPRPDPHPDAGNQPHALVAIRSLERLRSESSLAGERFGSMLREISAPELLVLTILLYDAGRSKDTAEDAVRRVGSAVDRLQLGPDDRRTVEFLIRQRLQMSLMAFRHDTGDPGVVGGFAALFNTEEQLKMLCLITVADLDAMGPDALTPWKAELLWRLFVDTYNQLTMAYGDEVIDSHDAALTTLNANRPHDISEGEMAAFLEGLPRRYLTLFEPESIYQHVRLGRNVRPDDVHFFLNKRSDVWELTVVTLDKPYLFSNICGVLSYFDFDILRGYALTSLTALVLDVFQFTDRRGCHVRPQLDPLLSSVVAGRADITALLLDKARSAPPRIAAGTPPVLYFDQDSSPRYTILELVADDRPGLLHRISRIISRHGCVVDLVLISTEGARAIDVFHMRRDSAKLTDADELALTEDFERMLSQSPQDD